MLKLTSATKTFMTGRNTAVRAVRGVDLTLEPGKILGVLGESGSGKSTLARLMVRADTLTSGTVTFDGHDVTRASEAKLRKLNMRRRVQIVFQDPYASFDPTISVRRSMEDAGRWLLGRRSDISDRVDELAVAVGIEPGILGRSPEKFSGGQLQRMAIARALLGEPEFLIADESVSALDASVRASIVDLICELRDTRGLGILFVSHDVSLVCSISDRVAVMYAGRKVEELDAADVQFGSAHPYTQGLLNAVPKPGGAPPVGIPGEPASPSALPVGCAFAPRCFAATDICREKDPALLPLAEKHYAACFHPGTREETSYNGDNRLSGAE